jgi:DNA-binding transcriptional MerR regulator
VARICGVSPRRLRYWERTDLVRPSTVVSSDGPESDTSGFGFRDLVSVKSIVELLEQGVPLRKIRRGIDEVRSSLPGLDPVSALRWQAAARCMVVRHEGVLMEFDGQLVLEFPRVSEAPVAKLAEHLAGQDAPEAYQRAQQFFEEGCSLDTEPSTWDQAEEAYRKAIEADPSYADAHCNLGSVCFNRGRRDEARQSFERAIELVPGHVEANLNIGTMYEELGQDESALARYRAALESDPLYADVHVSLALLYEKISLVRTAASHWRRYLQLDPQGTWADVARRRIATH